MIPRTIAEATATPARIRPRLDVEAKARRNCRNNLIGMRVVNWAGTGGTIQATMWDAEGKLTIQINPRGEFVPAAFYTLVGNWEFKCCRGRLGTDGFPKRRKAAR